MPNTKPKPDHLEIVNLRESKEKTPSPENQERISSPDGGKGFELPSDSKIEKPGDNKTELPGLSEGKAGPELIRPGVASRPVAQRQKEIEEVMSKNIDKYYLKMDKPTQMEFKRVGEETAKKINQILLEGKVKARKIIDLIRTWLAMIPGINKYFIEQETKIKTDEIIKLSGK